MFSGEESVAVRKLTGLFEIFKWTLKADVRKPDMENDVLRIRNIHDSVWFAVNSARRTVTVSTEADIDVLTMQHLLLDLLLPRLIAYDGLLVLHGSLISHASFGLGFIAESGFGKSTLAASFQGRDGCLLGDDALIVRRDDRGWLGQALYPSLRLFPDSIKHLFPKVSDTDPVADYTDKRRVSIAAETDSVSLRGLFRLTEPGHRVRITRLSPASACMAIIANAFALDPDDVAETGRRFAKASDLALALPVFDLTYPRDYACLPEVQAAVLATLDGLSERS